MTTEWNGDAAFAAIQKQAAENLLAAAVLYENTLRQKVSTHSPFYKQKRVRDTSATKTGGPVGSTYRIYNNPSRPGEYPKLRTGAGQKSITHEPHTVAEVMKTLYVRVGYVEGDHHLLFLEFGRGNNGGRKGLIDLLDEMRPQLSALATAGFRNDR
jgi:hypothetical protein